MKTIKVVNGFVWHIIPYELAKDVLGSGLFSVYKLHEDGSESLCESYECIADACECGLDFGIEVGHLEN
jgi:hypothetical protein